MYSTSLFAFSMTISATCTWCVACSSKVEAITSAFTFLFISVTSSGLSSTRRTISITSGWFVVMALAIFCINTVLPVRGGATIRDLCPFPIGQKRSTTLVESSDFCPSSSISKLRRLFGKRGVRVSKGARIFAILGSSPFTEMTLMTAADFSFSLGALIWPRTVSPVFRPTAFIIDAEI